MKNILLPFFLALVPVFIIAQPLITFQPVVTGLDQPVDIVEVNDSSHRLFIAERTGKIRIWKDARLLSAAFLDVSTVIKTSGSEQGLLSLAFHPDYKDNGYFFIYYTDTSGAITIARYHRSNDSIADASSGVILLKISKKFANHNGGHLLFGTDRYLYFGTGDGGSGGDPDDNAQNGQSLLGKMLRIDVNNPNSPYYSIPSGNPFAGSTTTREEIIATGLRNPWRWSFDKQTGDMWIADVGQNEWEEVNVVPASNILNKDYGWSCFEGTHAFKGCAAKPNNVSPIFDYPHTNATGGFSITGGYVYRGTEFPSLQGYYICSDYVSGNGWLIKPDGNGGWNTTMQSRWPNLSSFGEAIDGTLYATSLSGTLYKVVASNPLPVQLVSFTARTAGNTVELKWMVEYETAGDLYVIEKRNGLAQTFVEVNRTKATSDRSSNNYVIAVPTTQEQAFYRLKIISHSSELSYSQVVHIDTKPANSIKAYVTGSNLDITVPTGTTFVGLLDGNGKALLKKKVNAGERQIKVPLTNFAKGIISIVALVNEQRQVKQIVY